MNYPTAIVAAGGLALALVAVPVQFESGDLMPSKSIALADKGGNSGDHSNAGGGGNGRSTRGGCAFGVGGHTSHIFGHPGNRSSIASRLKGLNVAHANQNAFDNAALGSRVGLLAVYLLALPDDEAAALLDATKGNDNINTTDSEVIARVRALLGL